MTRYAPLLTLGAVAALGGALLAVDVLSDPGQAPPPAPAAAAAPAPAPAAEPVAVVPDPPAVAESVWAGRSSGNEVTVAIAVKDGRAVAYVCDGKQIEAWLEGTLEGDTLSLTSGDGTTTITGTATEADALGTVAVGDKQWPYAAKAVVAPAGLYEGRANVDGVAARIGWIVLDDGSQTGLAEVNGQPRPAPVLDPAAPGSVTFEGAPVTVTTIDGDDTVVAR